MLIFAIISSCTAILGVVAAFWAVYYTRSDRRGKKATEVITGIVTKIMSPMEQRMVLIEQKTGPEAQERDRLFMKGMILEALHPIEHTVTDTSSKVDGLIGQLSIIMAQLLHQPDPARRPVDILLEAFMDGTLTLEERLELRKYLTIIKNWKPEQESPFPIHSGEQLQAAIMLLTMDFPVKNLR